MGAARERTFSGGGTVLSRVTPYIITSVSTPLLDSFELLSRTILLLITLFARGGRDFPSVKTSFTVCFERVQSATNMYVHAIWSYKENFNYKKLSKKVILFFELVAL